MKEYLKPNGHVVLGKYCLRPLENCDRGFESRYGHGCVSAFCCIVLLLADPLSKEYYQMSK